MFKRFKKENHINIAEFINDSRNANIEIWEYMKMIIYEGSLPNIAIVNITDSYQELTTSYVVDIDEYYQYINIKQRGLKIKKIKNMM